MVGRYCANLHSVVSRAVCLCNFSGGFAARQMENVFSLPLSKCKYQKLMEARHHRVFYELWHLIRTK